jgi:DNA polymerase iota
MKSNVTAFIDSHDIGKIPGIGFKMSQKIRNHILSRPANYNDGLIYGETKETISVGDVRLHPGMGPELLEKLLGGPGAERGIGGKVWNLINGVDDTEVRELKKIPT